ncbi:MAG: hypothetical protein LWX07_09055 [Bacteroidetes bacterium]|nr:hypothetical protein [Bacteroidota bacterium]
MDSSDNLFNAISSLEKYITTEGYRGYDPYDGLMSPLFRLPVLRSSKTIRLYSQQIIKRLPFNARPLLFIKKGLNPVTLGLCAQGYTYLLKSGAEGKQFSAEYLESRIRSLIELLADNSSKGFSGYCWGYEFDWEAKYASNPAYTPTVVATGIITNGLFEYYRYSKDENVLRILESAAEFVTKDLRKNYEDNLFCYSYSPFDNQKVFEASRAGVLCERRRPFNRRSG